MNIASGATSRLVHWAERAHFGLVFLALALTPLLIPLGPRQSIAVLGIPILLFWLLRPRSAVQDLRARRPAALLMCGVAGWALASWFWADDPVVTGSWAWRVAGMLLLAVLINTGPAVYSGRQVRRACRLLFLVWPITIAIVLVLAAGERGWIDLSGTFVAERSIGVLNNSMQAMALLVLITPVLARVGGLKGSPAIAGALIAMGLTLTVVYAYSEAATLALGAGAAVLVLTLVRPVWGLAALLVLMAGAVALPAGLAVGLYPDQLAALREVWPGSYLVRLEIWSFALEAIAQRPLLGWGVEASRTLVLEGRDPLLLPTAAIPLHPHSGPLQILLDLGAVGGLLMAGFVALSIRFLWRAPPVTRACGFAVMAAAVSVYAVSLGAWQEWWLAYLGVTAAVLRGCARWEADLSAPGTDTTSR